MKQQLQPWIPTWEDLRDQEVRKVDLESAIELRHVAELQKLKQAELTETACQLKEFGESEARVRAHRTQARVWRAVGLGSILVTALGIWLGAGFFMDALAERLAITATLVVISVAGGTVLLSALTRQVREERLRIIVICAAALVIGCGILAAVTLGIGRMVGNTAVATHQRELLDETGDLAANAAAPSPLAQRIHAVAGTLEKLSVLWAILIAVGGELATLLTVHLWLQHAKVVRIVEPVFRKYHEIRQELVVLARREEELRQEPRILHIKLTLAGYRQEQERALALQAERSRQEARRAEEAKRAAERGSLGYWLKWTLIGFGTLLAMLLGTVWAFAGNNESQTPTMVIVLDLSSSAGANAEFARNLQAVEALIRRVPAGGVRLVILGVTEASFGTASLLTLTSPRTPGRLGEYQASWQASAVGQWRKLARTLAPNAKGSDLFGALARAALEFAEAPPGPKHLLVLSDMRQVGRGFNFERKPGGDPVRIVVEIQHRAPIPKLGGVEVWVLGVHTVGIDEGHWNQLRAIWCEYFRQAGATVRLFSPNRRWQGQ